MGVGKWIQGPDVEISQASVRNNYYRMRIIGGSETARRTWDTAIAEYKAKTQAYIATNVDLGNARIQARYTSAGVQDRAYMETSLVQVRLSEFEGGTVHPGYSPPGATIEYESGSGVFVPSTYQLEVNYGWQCKPGAPVDASIRQGGKWPDLSVAGSGLVDLPVSQVGVSAMPIEYSVSRSGTDGGLGSIILESSASVINYALVPHAAITGVDPTSFVNTNSNTSDLYVDSVNASVSGIYTPPRYRFITPEPEFRGIVGLRQRQTLTANTASWPLRQRQNGGANGSWLLRQRQAGI